MSSRPTVARSARWPRSPGDKESDIFDGLAVTTSGDRQLRYVPGEVVGAIFAGEVTLTIAATATLAPVPGSASGDGLPPGEAVADEAVLPLARREPLSQP